MNAIASQITGVSIVSSPVCSGTDQRKHQSSASLTFVREIHLSLVNSPHRGPLTRKMFPFDGVIMLDRHIFAHATTTELQCHVENCSDFFLNILYLSKRNFHRFLIAMGKVLVKQACRHGNETKHLVNQCSHCSVTLACEFIFSCCASSSDNIFLIHWGRDKMDAISKTTFLTAFSWMKMFEFRLNFHWSLFLRVQFTIFQHWFR